MPVAFDCPKCFTRLPDGVGPADACPVCGTHLSDLDTATARRGDGAREDATQVSPAPPAPASPPAAEPARLGPYRVLGKLGAGGMGEVYRAEDAALRRQVALKVMLPQFAADPTARARFLREARAAAAVEHDHIVPIFHVGEDGGTAFLAMPLLKGETLAEYLKGRGALPLPEALRIGREIADGLAAAHAAGLVHRDIKPANVWLEGSRRRVRILDFGLARAADGTDAQDDSTLTKEGAVVGTPTYMSPEQGLSEPLDARSDLWSLGVVLYLMTTGRVPFRGPTTMATLTAIAVDHPRPPGELNPGIPRPLNDLILALLNKNPARRPAAADAVARRLSEVEVGLTAVAIADVPPAHDLFAHLDDDPGVGPTPVANAAGPRSLLLVWLALALLVVGGGVTLTLITIRTPNGTLVIDTADPAVEVVVKQDGAVVRDRTRDREIELKVGDYTIELAEKKDGLRLSTNKFELTKNGKVVVRAYLEPKAAPVVVRPKPAGDPATPFANREIHGATPDGLKEWAADLPKHFRPTAVSQRAGATEALLDAVASYDPAGTEWDLQPLVPPTDTTFWDEHLNKGFQPEIMCPVPGGTTVLWVRGHRGWGKWHGDERFIQNKLAVASEEGTWPVGLNAQDGHFELALEPGATGARRWEAFTTLTEDRLADQIRAARARNRRPALLTAHGGAGPVRFAAVFADNRPGVDWEFTPHLTGPEFEKARDGFAARGYGLRLLASAVEKDTVRYTAVWESDPRRPEVTPAGRKAVQWVLAAGGAVGVLANGKPYLHVGPENAADLPAGPFALVNVSLSEVKATDDTAVEHLRDLPPVRGGLHLSETAVTGVGLAKLATYPGLAGIRSLHLTNVPLTDTDLAPLARFSALDTLHLKGTAVSGPGLAHLRGLNLTAVELNDCDRLGDAGLEALAAVATLKSVWAFNTKVTDAGLRKFEHHPALGDLAVNGPQITDATAAFLAGRPKTWRIHLGSSKVTDDGLAKLKALPALTELWLTEGSGVTASGLAQLAGFPALTSVSLLGGGDGINDEIAAGLAACQKLETLDLSGCKVTEPAVKKMAAALTGCQITWDGGVFEPTKK